jgi:hypothetical protein
MVVVSVNITFPFWTFLDKVLAGFGMTTAGLFPREDSPAAVIAETKGGKLSSVIAGSWADGAGSALILPNCRVEGSNPPNWKLGSLTSGLAPVMNT